MSDLCGKDPATFDFRNILYEKDGPRATVTINRPAVLNCVNLSTLRELQQAFLDASWDDAIAVVVLTGAGDRAFCTGADLNEQHADYVNSPADYWKWMGEFCRAHDLLRHIGKPTVARLNGMVVGGGNEFNMSCDLAVAAEDIIIKQVGAAMGSVAAGGATQWLPLIVGDRRAREILMLCEDIPAGKAFEWGLVNRVVPRADLDKSVDDMCATLTAKLPECMRYTKQQLNFWKDFSWSMTIGHARDWLAVHNRAPEVHEGLAAFVGKRPVDYEAMRRGPRFSTRHAGLTTPDTPEGLAIMAHEILVERDAHIGILKLNRPDVLNALSLAVMKQLVKHLDAFDNDPEIYVIVLTGGDRVWAAGADINDMAEASAFEMYERNQFARWERIKRITKPIVAAVSGYALGGGCELAMLCDIIVASETAQFGQPEINIGVIPGAGGTQRLTRAVGKAVAMDVVLGGRFLSAREALRCGLVSRVVPRENCYEEALKIARNLSRKPPLALRLAKESVLKAHEMSLSDGLEYERKLFYMLFATEDQKEGMAAFVENAPSPIQGPLILAGCDVHDATPTGGPVSEYETITCDLSDGVATLTLNRPDVFNAFNEAMTTELDRALRAAGKDDAVRAVVLTGAGKAFSSGQDLKDLKDNYVEGFTPVLGDRLRKGYNPVILRMRRLEKPIIAAINGVAAGAGCSLALAADLRTMSEKAALIEVFINVGLVPDSGSTFTLPRLVGLGKAMELCLTGDKVGAAEALRLGLVNRVCTPGDLAAETHALAARFAALPTRAIGLTKRLLNATFDHTLEEQLEAEAFYQETAGKTADHFEGVRAFIEKRNAVFKGM